MPVKIVLMFSFTFFSEITFFVINSEIIGSEDANNMHRCMNTHSSLLDFNLVVCNE